MWKPWPFKSNNATYLSAFAEGLTSCLYFSFFNERLTSCEKLTLSIEATTKSVCLGHVSEQDIKGASCVWTLPVQSGAFKVTDVAFLLSHKVDKWGEIKKKASHLLHVNPAIQHHRFNHLEHSFFFYNLLGCKNFHLHSCLPTPVWINSPVTLHPSSSLYSWNESASP